MPTREAWHIVGVDLHSAQDDAASLKVPYLFAGSSQKAAATWGPSPLPRFEADFGLKVLNV